MQFVRHRLAPGFKLPITWGELLKRTGKDTIDDDCLSLAAQLAYYFFLALFPTVLFLLAVASFFPLYDLTDEISRMLRPFVSPEVLRLIEEQMQRLADSENGGILTFGLVGAIWSSSAALVSIVRTLNRAYDVEEGRPWWKVRLVAIGLTQSLGVFCLLSLALIVAGPWLATYLGQTVGFGPVFEWTWKIAQWPVAFLLVSTAIGTVYYFGPDVDQPWAWLTPGAVTATTLWLLSSLGLKFYVVNFTDYNASYGAVGGVIVLLLWFYLSGLAILVGAEMNAEIDRAMAEHAGEGVVSPGSKDSTERDGVSGERPRPAPAPGTASDRAAAMSEDGRSLAALVQDLGRDVAALLSQEVALARAEFAGKLANARLQLGLIAVGVLLALAGFLVLSAALVLVATALGMAPWAAALVIALLTLGGGAALAYSAFNRLRTVGLVPTETLESLKENATWLKAQTRK